MTGRERFEHEELEEEEEEEEKYEEAMLAWEPPPFPALQKVWGKIS